MNAVAHLEPNIPNTGRILDHWLGGSHHFAADRAAAAAFDGIYPEFPRVFKTLRDFIGRAVRRQRACGIDQFVVLGAGIPTRGNVHEMVPDARVLYTDIDPITIDLGQKILEGSPSAAYGYCDAGDLATLDRALVERTLGPPRRLGLVVIGCAVFLSDDKLRRLFADLHAWAPRGSMLAFDFDSRQLSSYPAALAILGDGFFMRTPAEFGPLLGPWRLDEDGIQPVAAWRAPDPPVIPTFMYGGIAIHDA